MHMHRMTKPTRLYARRQQVSHASTQKHVCRVAATCHSYLYAVHMGVMNYAVGVVRARPARAGQHSTKRVAA
jgi:hypothetical protein